MNDQQRAENILLWICVLLTLFGLPAMFWSVGTLDAERIADRNCLQYYKDMSRQESEVVCNRILKGVK